MPRPVIVGVDFRERSQDALLLGRQLAAALDTELVVAHVFAYDAHRVRFEYGDPERPLREDAAQRLRALLEGWDRAPRLMTVPDTSPARGLHELAEAEDAEVLVTASSHRGALGRIFLGDVGQQTMHGAPCAVAIAPRGYAAAQRAAMATIGVGFDGGDEARAALTLAAELASGLTASLRLLASSYVTPVPGSVGQIDTLASFAREERAALRRDVEDAVAALPVACEIEMSAMPPVEQLLRLSSEVDLLVLGSRGHGAVSRLLAGSTSDAVVRDAACPVLVLPRGPHAEEGDQAPAEARVVVPARV